jgi:hypothetical protein
VDRVRKLYPMDAFASRALAATLVLTVGCSGTTATIRRTDGPPIEAEIDSSDGSSLRLRGPSGNLVKLDQYQVADIDHPGNVWATIGGVYAAGGLMFTAVWLNAERNIRANGERGNGFDGMVGFIGIGALVLGAAVLLPNLFVWGRSKVHAHAFEAERPPDWMIPPAVPGEPEPIAPIRPPVDGTDDEVPDKKPPTGFHR